MKRLTQCSLACLIALTPILATSSPAKAAPQAIAPTVVAGPPTVVDPATLAVQEIVTGLEHPWSLAILPDGRMLVTEKPGRLRIVTPEGTVSEPLAGVPDVAARGQGGLLDVVLGPQFAQDRMVYLAFAESGDEGMGTAVGRGRLSADAASIEGFQVIFRQLPKRSTGNHFGSRIVFAGDGMMYIALGENNHRPTAQGLDNLQGKIVRLHPDGTVPADNPFVGQANARPEIWTYGQRNPQGLAVHPLTGEPWSSEHGPRGGDEVNLVLRGQNFGWPLATHGINYSGQPIPEAKGKEVAGMVPPLYVWERSPGLSGMAFHAGQGYPQWNNSLFLGALVSRDVIRLTLDGTRVVAEERLLDDQQARIRDVRIGPDGALYVLTDEANGRLLKVVPAAR